MVPSRIETFYGSESCLLVFQKKDRLLHPLIWWPSRLSRSSLVIARTSSRKYLVPEYIKEDLLTTRASPLSHIVGTEFGWVSMPWVLMRQFIWQVLLTNAIRCIVRHRYRHLKNQICSSKGKIPTSFWTDLKTRVLQSSTNYPGTGEAIVAMSRHNLFRMRSYLK